MKFRRPNLKLPLLAIAAGAMVLTAAAQNSGQSIIFSAPSDDKSQSDAPSLASPDSHFPSQPSTFQGSSPFINFNAPNYGPLPPRPQVSAANQQQMEKMLEDRKDWTQMTPAEIFGVAPEEKKIGTPGSDVAAQDKSQTPLDHYFEQQKKSQASRTGDWRNDPAGSPWNQPRGLDGANPSGSARNGTDDKAGQNANGFPGSRWNGIFSANQNPNPSWDSFSSPPQQTPVKPNLEQLAAMQRFRDLLAPSPAPADAAAADSKFFPVPKIEVDPNFTQPAFVPNPAGASFTPLSDDIGRPAGLTPLPGIVAPVSLPVVSPSWAPQPAPWLSQTPQPFTIPQRKF